MGCSDDQVGPCPRSCPGGFIPGGELPMYQEEVVIYRYVLLVVVVVVVVRVRVRVRVRACACACAFKNEVN